MTMALGPQALTATSLGAILPPPGGQSEKNKEIDYIMQG